MKKQLTLITTILIVTLSYSQKMKIESGDFSFIKNQKEINVEFVYDDMTLYKDHKTNEEYMKERSTKLEEKSRGTGKAWEKLWISSREITYAPKFLELINKYIKKKGETHFSREALKSKYTLIVNSIWLYPGYNVGVMKKGAKLTTKLTFVETDNRDNVVLSINAKNAPGDVFGGSYSNEHRIGEAYAKTGKTLAGLILKKAF